MLSCSECKYFLPHIIYRYIGFCSMENRIIFEDDEACSKYFNRVSELYRVVNKEPLYCVSCNCPLFSAEEYKEHRKDMIYQDFYVDEFIYEEIYAGD